MPRNLGLLKSRILRPNPWTGCYLEIEARVSEVGDNTIVLLGITSETGDIIVKASLPQEHHPQAEGLAILPSGQLIIADEGSKLQPSQISIYPA